MMFANAAAATHVGMLREGNEDSYLCIDGLYFVADGMGGHSAGEVASDIAVTTLSDLLGDVVANGLTADDLAAAIRHANTAILTEALRDRSKAGMGTTLTGLAVADPQHRRVLVANVGDSRTYLWRHGELRQITKDHSHVQSLVDRGAITRAEARVHHQRNIVLRAMGIDPDLEVDVFELDIEDGDRFIVCSDGLVDEADDDAIEMAVRTSADPQDLADSLVILANSNGGRDNITVVVVDFSDAPVDVTEPMVRAATDDVTVAIPVERRPSRLLDVAAFGSFLVSAAIVITVIVSALTQ
jgi:serine/threonine protein phosphatase PrpC